MPRSWNQDGIRKAIADIHRRSSGDYQSLMRQVDKESAKHRLVYNIPQMLATMARTSTLLLEWGRGTGKTTFHGDRIRKCVTGMPRSTGLFIGPTYQAILTRIIPSLVQGLEMQGLFRNLHYFVGEMPPRSWRKWWGTAYQPPDRVNNYITFYNGTGIHLISHDVPGDGRGLNTDWIVGDEAALLKLRNLEENTDPTLRGSKGGVFEKDPLFGSKAYSSSTPLTPEGKWFIEYEERAMMEPEKYTFLSADSRFNAHNLRPGYLEEAERNAYQRFVFLAEYRNVRLKVVRDGFYSLLDPDIHAYTNFDYNYYDRVGKTPSCLGDTDLIKGQPLILDVDWGANINAMVVCQNLTAIQEYRALKNFYVLGDDRRIQDDMFDDFDRYYNPHKGSCNLLYLWYDNTGNNRTGFTKKTRAEQARDQLTKKGWRVVLMTRGGSNPLHEKKQLLWERILQEADPRYPKFRVNKANCRELWISMTNAKTKQGRHGIEKDKSSERSTKIERQYATDLSDAIDAGVFGQFGHLVTNRGNALPTGT